MRVLDTNRLTAFFHHLSYHHTGNTTASMVRERVEEVQETGVLKTWRWLVAAAIVIAGFLSYLLWFPAIEI